MQCPVCIDELLIITERQGIEIDYCPRCRGIWLDRGELDKILERTHTLGGSVEPSDPIQNTYSRKPKNDDRYKTSNPIEKYTRPQSDHHRRYHDEPRRRKTKRLKDYVEDIFDIFD